MRIIVKYFAALRETTGREQEAVELPDGATVEAARDVLAERYPAVARLLPSCAAAVNRAYVQPSATLAEGDELAFIPPLGGG